MLKTVHYYRQFVSNPMDIVVGEIGVTLMPDYVRNSADCAVVTGLLDSRNKLERESPILEREVPDYSMLDRVDFRYSPTDAYFLKATKGCIRKCRFCAVPKLEPQFGRYKNLGAQINDVIKRYGERQHLVMLDNNVLAQEDLSHIIDQIRNLGFGYGTRRNGKLRVVDFNQGIDARLITNKPAIAKWLATINLSPVRLAFDTLQAEDSYRKAVELLAAEGFRDFTNYMLYNFHDTPEDFYTRLQVNLELAETFGIHITGFPMRYVPIDSVARHHVSPNWKWRYLRGIRCVLLATHGLVGTQRDFVEEAFGKTYDEFIELISMPDRYIIYRNQYKESGTKEWKRLYRRLPAAERSELMDTLDQLNRYQKGRQSMLKSSKRFQQILRHYYPENMSPGRQNYHDE